MVAMTCHTGRWRGPPTGDGIPGRIDLNHQARKRLAHPIPFGYERLVLARDILWRLCPSSRRRSARTFSVSSHQRGEGDVRGFRVDENRRAFPVLLDEVTVAPLVGVDDLVG